jgi:hypothetical protein
MMSITLRGIAPALLLLASTGLHAGIIHSTSGTLAGHLVQGNFQSPGHGAADGSPARWLIDEDSNASINAFGSFTQSGAGTGLEIKGSAAGSGANPATSNSAASGTHGVSSIVPVVAPPGGGPPAEFPGNGSTSPWPSDGWIFAPENLPYPSSDQDFNDPALITETVVPVPAPATITLLGAGLLGLALARRRRST